MIDYHVHTSLCNHARGSMETYIRRAVAIGLNDICFLDHLTIQPSETNLSMAPGEVPFYFQALQRLKQRYKGVINIRIGLEIDFNPTYIDLFQEIIARFSFDVIGGSLHFPGDLNINLWTSRHQINKSDRSASCPNHPASNGSASPSMAQPQNSTTPSGRCPVPTKGRWKGSGC